jgi:hypothetical protein
MDAKETGVIIGVIVFLMLGVCFGAYQCGTADARDSGRTGADTATERQLLERIGEYEQRERERIEAENSRIRREEERIERTKSNLESIRGLDRRTIDLYQALRKEISILQDYLDSSERELAGYRRDGAGDSATVEVGE